MTMNQMKGKQLQSRCEEDLLATVKRGSSQVANQMEPPQLGDWWRPSHDWAIPPHLMSPLQYRHEVGRSPSAGRI